MSFKNFPALLALYLNVKKYKQWAIEKCVQFGVSELAIIESTREAADLGMTVMYVLPKYESRNRFVNNRINKLYRDMPKYRSLWKEAKSTHRTSLMHIGTGTIVYVGSNVSTEFVEIPIDSGWVDEKDKCNQSNLLLLPDRYVASPFKYHREIANPTIEGFGIDERYQKSTQEQWTIKCPHCNKFIMPDFFKHVVREVDKGIYLPRDTKWKEGKEPRLICECGKPLDRLSEGEYVAEFKDKQWHGTRLNEIYNKFYSLGLLVDEWKDAQNNDTKTQIFYNNRLGLPFSSKGAKITISDLNNLKRKYIMPKSTEARDNPRIMGIDVGAGLNVVIRDLVKVDGIEERRLIHAEVVSDFQAVYNLLDEWRPKIAVIDNDPEIHEVMRLKSKYRNVYSSRFQEGLRKINLDKENRHITMDRTAILDYVKQFVDEEILILPSNVEFIPFYYDQLTASTRILETDEDNPDKAKYTWVHAKPDHYHLAEVYCCQAWMCMPSWGSTLEFFKAEAAKARPSSGNVKDDLDELSASKREELERLSKMRPEQFLANIQKDFAKKDKK